jgi:transposase
MLEQLMHEAQMMKQQGKRIGQIAEALGKSERMVHYYLSEPSRPRKKREYTSKLDPFKPYIDTILEDDSSINREVLLRRLRRQKYDGGITILRDYAAKKSEEITRKAVIRFETEPGYQAQVDWKVLGKHLVDGRWQKLYAFVMVFGYSRKPFVIHTASMDMATFLMCHVLSFTYFGGVPEEVLYDNMKTAFIYQAAEEKWQVNKHLLSLARHYGFTPRRCQVRRPQTKGKVERFIHFYDNNFWVEKKQQPVSLDELNEAALEWIDEISVRTIGGLNESRNERFAHEKAFLTTLPKHSFDCRTPMPARVSTEALVRVKSNWYSVPPEYIGATLTVKIDPLANIAQVLDGQQVVTSFAVIVDEKNQRLYQREHRMALMQLWRTQYRIPKPKRRVRIPADVSTRSPGEYDRIFALSEVAS